MKTTNIARHLSGLLAGAAAIVMAGALIAPPAVAQKTKVVVYTALEADDLKKYKDRFEQDVKDVDIQWVRDSTGVIEAKLLAEKNNPQADVIWGLAATSLLRMSGEGMLHPYAPAGLDKVSPRFRDSANPPAWVGMDVWAATICYNTVEKGKKKLPDIASWQDLTKPEFKGAITMPHPASSGTGYLMVSSWLQVMGEDAGWKFMDALHNNVGVYVHSGSKPCRQAGAGEYPVGISFEFRASRTKRDGAPIDIVFPKEGLGWDMEATAIVKGTKNLAAAQKVADWSASAKANEMYAEGYAITAVQGVAKQLPHLPTPAQFETMLAKNDFLWAANNRQRILAEWNKRYNAKAEPKS
jgi:iron(III) transport system substrate-binding protein